MLLGGFYAAPLVDVTKSNESPAAQERAAAGHDFCFIRADVADEYAVNPVTSDDAGGPVAFEARAIGMGVNQRVSRRLLANCLMLRSLR